MSRHESFSDLGGITIFDDQVCVADYKQHCIWKVDRTSQAVSAYAGIPGKSGHQDGPSNSTRFDSPVGIASSDSSLFVADYGNHRIRKVLTIQISRSFEHKSVFLKLRGDFEIVSTVAGNGVRGEKDGECLTEALFDYPCGIALKNEKVLVSSNSCTIRQIEIDGRVTTLAGSAGQRDNTDGHCTEAKFNYPYQIAVGPDGSVYVADQSNGAIRKIENNNVSTVCKNLNQPFGVAVDDDGNVYFSDCSHRIYKLASSSGDNEILCGSGAATSLDGKGELASLHYPRHLFYDSESGYLYFTEKKAVRRVRVRVASRSFKPFYEIAFSRDLARLIDNEEIAPIDKAVFLVQGKRISVTTKSILCIRSDYFNRMFSSNWKSSKTESAPISIEDATYESFYAIITFLLTGCLEVQKYANIMPDILVLADRFLISNLRDFCVTHLAKTVSTTTAIDYLSFADEYGFKDLRDRCLQFVVRQYKVLCKDPQFQTLDSKILAEIIRLIAE